MKKLIVSIAALGLLALAWGHEARASCEVNTATQSLANGSFLSVNPCTASGGMKVSPSDLSSGEDQTNNLLMTSGGVVRGTATNLMSAVSTNTTGSAVTGYTGSKTVQANLNCNAGGSTNCGITVTIYGSAINTQATGTFETLCTLTIPTGTAVQTYTCNPITGSFLYLWAATTGVAGTSPSLNVGLMY